jgi:multimeric flavodoxin WrbA
MKALGIVGSPRENGNTEIITNHTLKAIEEEGIEVKTIRLSGLDIRPCQACMYCRKEEKCAINDDLNPIYFEMKDADAIILSSPVYVGSTTGLMKCFMERTAYIALPKKVFTGKIGGPLVVARRAGQNFTLAQLNYWFQINGFFLPSSTYWNMAIAREKGEVTKDEEGMKTAWTFGKNVAYSLKKMNQ